MQKSPEPNCSTSGSDWNFFQIYFWNWIDEINRKFCLAAHIFTFARYRVNVMLLLMIIPGPGHQCASDRGRRSWFSVLPCLILNEWFDFSRPFFIIFSPTLLSQQDTRFFSIIHDSNDGFFLLIFIIFNLTMCFCTPGVTQSCFRGKHPWGRRVWSPGSPGAAGMCASGSTTTSTQTYRSTWAATRPTSPANSCSRKVSVHTTRKQTHVKQSLVSVELIKKLMFKEG